MYSDRGLIEYMRRFLGGFATRRVEALSKWCGMEMAGRDKEGRGGVGFGDGFFHTRRPQLSSAIKEDRATCLRLRVVIRARVDVILSSSGVPTDPAIISLRRLCVSGV